MRIGLIGAGRIGALHAATLSGLPSVTEIVLTDADLSRAQEIGAKVGATVVAGVDELFAAGLDGVVIAAPTAAHAELITAAAAAGVATFCEKPVAADAAGTRSVLEKLGDAGGRLQVGFQRRFDAGHTAVRDAVRSGRLGWLHTLRACTYDPSPPPPEYIPLSGGIFRDCSVHDFDMVRWVTGREVVEVYATGGNRGARFIAEAGDVDTGMAVLTLDDGTLAVCNTTRYNGAGYDVRLEAFGSQRSLVAGLDDSAPLASAEGGAWPPGPAYAGFAQRFRDAYVAELAAFCDVAAGRAESACNGEEALRALLIAEAAELSRRQGRPVQVAEVAQ